MAAIDVTDPPLYADERHMLMACEVYQAWQAAFDDAEDAFLAWCAAPVSRRYEAYTVYRAAADREDVAAQRWLLV